MTSHQLRNFRAEFRTGCVRDIVVHYICLLYTNGNSRRVMILFTAEKGHKNTIVGYKQNSYIAYNLIA